MKAMDRVLNRLMDAIKAKHWLYWMSSKYFHRDAVFSTKNPGSYQAPSRTPQSEGSNDKRYVHLDVFRRGRKLNNDDYYLDPLNGKLRKLFVQTTDTIYESNTDVRSWRRTYIRNVSPRLIRLAFWPYSAAPSSRATHKLKRRDILDKVNSKTADWDQSHWVAVGARWLPACIGLLVLMCLPTDAEGQVRNNGFYDPVPYKWWSYPTAARNIYEDRNVQALSKTKHVLMERRHLPRFLCFTDRVRDRNKYPRGRMTPEEWMKETGESVPPAYLFVSYTGEHFKRACPEGWKQFGQRGKVECNCEQCQSHKSDVEFLHEKSRQAAKEIGVIAYWTDQNCMSTDEVEHSQDVYSICDIVRAACSIAIIVGQAGTNELPQDVTTSDLLKEWGERLWTYPEILLSPIGKPITVYTRGSSRKPWQVSKAHFAKLIWNDADSSRQLMEHYENSLTLSRLELVVIALECMTNRVHRGTTNYKEGDLAYCLMGLLRQRPRVEADDTAFQAFARLSLSNDSDQLLERMICLLTNTKSEDQRIVKNAKGDEEINNRHWWTNLEDAWGVRLWDIEPLCQVAGIADNDTVILDGAYGATVTWDSFQRVAITTRETWSRMLARLLVRFSPVWFLTDLIILVIGSSSNDPGMIAFGVLLLLLVLTLILLSPMLVLNIYSGKVWNAQPWLFGFEGYMDLDAIERKIFGFPCDRLTWAPYSSPLSQHTLNEQFLDDECQGTTPLLSDTDSQAGNSSTAHEVNGMRLFTIVDTHTM
ncbi:hypothetical protein LTS08_003627 [Lithohypha guttulata]|uniref:Uncharacterized protein n=1 Tax=Lithohypha guttulata TaxID=1690604 RepID=A0AAN7YEJ9_9EURO|nr:hypothetical protein LTR05_005936 [Lithohypha guttulata]KAK5102826.1 hypothetical protein LTS08_003627 [Lithohypha guttulata]